jgi:hypothetical protein
VGGLRALHLDEGRIGSSAGEGGNALTRLEAADSDGDGAPSPHVSITGEEMGANGRCVPLCLRKGLDFQCRNGEMLWNKNSEHPQRAYITHQLL